MIDPFEHFRSEIIQEIRDLKPILPDGPNRPTVCRAYFVNEKNELDMALCEDPVAIADRGWIDGAVLAEGCSTKEQAYQYAKNALSQSL